MKFRSIVLSLLALCLSARGVPRMPFVDTVPIGRFSDIPIDIAAEKLDASGVLATASGNVQISYGDTAIFADEAQYDPTTRDVIATGNVRIYHAGQLVTAERAVYNLETKDIMTASVTGENFPFLYSGNSFQNIQGSTGYLVKGGVFTTHDSLHPDWSLRPRRVRMYPDDSVIMYDVDLYIGETPVIRWPYLYQSLNRENAFSLTPGYRSTWGGFLLGSFSFPLTEKIGATLRLDYLQKRGVAVGFGTRWKSKDDGGKNWGRFTSYGLYDSGTDINETSLARETVSAGRYRVSLQARQYITEDIYASVNINKLSDARFLQDFSETEFGTNPHPDNVVSVTKLSDDYTLTVLARKQLNEFFENTEQLPEAALDLTRQPIFGSKIFYEGQTSAGVYNRNFAKDASTVSDFGYTRFDTFHQFLFPHTYFGWLSIVPRAGVRGTWYSETGYIQSTSGTTSTLTSTAQASASSAMDQLIKTGSLFRPVYNAGAEASFKASRAFESVQSRTWGVDGLRHIIQPYANLSSVSTDTNGKLLYQIDRFQRSSQLPSIDFPSFSSIDSITNWSILRLGARNRLQTRRDDATFNWLEMDTYFDVRLDSPDFSSTDPDPGRYSNLVNRLKWYPLPWVSLSVDSQLPVLDTGFKEVNTDLAFLANANTSFTIGHRFLNRNVLYEDSSLLTLGAYFRLGDNWAVSALGTYEFRDNIFESQTYKIHRDLTSWVASLGFTARNNGTSTKAQYDYGVTLSFTLKDLPSVRLPISANASAAATATSSVTGN
jgi:lipopolysaccharide assembly outer membrane protein LptD (OstA)